VLPLAKEADANKESVKKHKTREKEMEGGGCEG
jgi:hypothetical protein